MSVLSVLVLSSIEDRSKPLDVLCVFLTFQIGLWGDFALFHVWYPILSCFGFGVHFEIRVELP